MYRVPGVLARNGDSIPVIRRHVPKFHQPILYAVGRVHFLCQVFQLLLKI
jgi:hypothetical protein